GGTLDARGDRDDLPAHARDGSGQPGAAGDGALGRGGGGGDGAAAPSPPAGTVSQDGSGSDFLSGTESEDSSSRLASMRARRIRSMTVISVFIDIRLSSVPAQCSSGPASPLESTARWRAVVSTASDASFKCTASSVKVSRSIIIFDSPLGWARVAKEVPARGSPHARFGRTAPSSQAFAGD